MATPDVEAALVLALKTVTDRTGTPSPDRPVEPPEIRLLRVPGGPGGTPWEDRPQVLITFHGTTRAQAWALERAAADVLEACNPSGGRLGGIFVDYARRVVDSVLTRDPNADIRSVATTWRFGIRRQ